MKAPSLPSQRVKAKALLRQKAKVQQQKGRVLWRQKEHSLLRPKARVLRKKKGRVLWRWKERVLLAQKQKVLWRQKEKALLRQKGRVLLHQLLTMTTLGTTTMLATMTILETTTMRLRQKARVRQALKARSHTLQRYGLPSNFSSGWRVLLVGSAGALPAAAGPVCLRRMRVLLPPLTAVLIPRAVDIPMAGAACGAHVHVQIEQGLAYFVDLATVGRRKVVALRDAVAAGGVPAAKAAYVQSRNAYEQIEVLAPGFPDVDCWIDCRASAPPSPPHPHHGPWTCAAVHA